MASDTSSTALRSLSPTELYSCLRHYLGIYRSVTVTSRYTGSIGQTEYLAALAPVVKEEPALHVGIKDDHLDSAYFVHLPTVDLAQLVTSKDVPFTSLKEYNEAVSIEQGLVHNEKFDNIATVPPWRVVILRPEGQDFIDVMLSYHHSLFDGTGGRLFHEQVLAQLNSSAPTEDFSPVLSFPEAPTMPPPQEDCVPFSFSKMYMAKVFWANLAPSFLRKKEPEVWCSAPVDFSAPYITRVKAVDVDAETVAALIKACREHSTTITGIMHGLVLAALAKRVDTNLLSSTTPITLRPYANSPPQKLGVFVTEHSDLFPEDMTADMRRQVTDEKIWKAAAHQRANMSAKLAELPKNDIMGLLHHVSDWEGFFKRKDGESRKCSWEVSNVGVSKAPAEGKHCISRLLFTNGANVAGSAVAFNVASAAGGVMTVAISWQDGILDDKLADGIAEDFEGYFENFATTGRFLAA